jgi:hypothetical protein
VAFRRRTIKRRAKQMASDAVTKGGKAMKKAVKRIQKAAAPKVKQLKKAAEPKIKELKKAASKLGDQAGEQLAKGMKGAKKAIKEGLNVSAGKLKKASRSM